MRGEVQSFGLVATKSIAKGASRASLDLISGQRLIFDAWTNEPWVVDGAAVRVSVVCAASLAYRSFLGTTAKLNGNIVDRINPDLSTGVDITKSKKLTENADIAFQGVKITGPFDINGEEAREMLALPCNPNGRKNDDVISRLYDINDIVGRDSDRWVVNFRAGLTEHQSALYEKPFKIVVDRVIPFRNDPKKCRSSEGRLKTKYWEFQRSRPELGKAVIGKSKIIVTPESSEHRLFVFCPTNVTFQGSLFCIAKDDEITLGILSSRIHEVWSTAQGNRLGAGNQRRYNIGVTFETFPFPAGMTPNTSEELLKANSLAQAIAVATKKLLTLRENWLNPADLIRRESEVVPGYPDRIIPKDEQAATDLKKRTLTDLYNERPSWLKHAHDDINAAVAAAYGWPVDCPDDDILARLLTLNAQRAS